MENGIALSPVRQAILEEKPIERYTLNPDDMKQYSHVVIKSNAIIDMELYGQDEYQLHGRDVQVLSTSFLMAQCLKQQGAKFDSNTIFEIPMGLFCEMWKIPFDGAVKKKGFVYRELIDSVDRLNNRKFLYPDVERSKMVKSGYFSYIKYNQTVVEFGFPPPIIDYINLGTEFTWYFLENVIKLQETSVSYRIAQYATLLYEHLQKSKFHSKYRKDYLNIFDLSSEGLRKVLGIEPGSYKRHIDFRTKVLDQAVLFIKERIGMEIKIENLSMGKRGVNGYRFITNMTSEDMDFIAAYYHKEKPIMSVSQRLKFSSRLSAHTTFEGIYRGKGESNADFIKRIEKLLSDNEKLVEFEPYLRAVGFKSKKFDAYITSLDEAVKAKVKEKQEEVSQGVLPLLDANQGVLPLGGDEENIPF